MLGQSIKGGYDETTERGYSVSRGGVIRYTFLFPSDLPPLFPFKFFYFSPRGTRRGYQSRRIPLDTYLSTSARVPTNVISPGQRSQPRCDPTVGRLSSPAQPRIYQDIKISRSQSQLLGADYSIWHPSDRSCQLFLFLFFFLFSFFLFPFSFFHVLILISVFRSPV